MPRTLHTLALLALITTVSGCGDSYDKVAADMTSSMKLLSNALKGVIDKPTAETAAAKIRAIGVSMQAIQDRLNKLGKPTKEQGDTLNVKFSAEINQANKEIATEMARINGLGDEVARPINEAMAAATKRP